MQRRVWPHFVHLINAPKFSNTFRNHISKRRNPSVQNQLVARLDLGKCNSRAAVLTAVRYLPKCLEDFAFIDNLNSDASPRRRRESWDDPATKRTQVPSSLGCRMVRVEVGNNGRGTERITRRSWTLDPHRAFSRSPGGNKSHLPWRQRGKPIIAYCGFSHARCQKCYSV